MSEYYKIPRHKNWNYVPGVKNNFKLSRSKIDLFMQCRTCFYIDNRLGISRPPGFPFNLNSAVDALLKKEFDIYREKGEPHPLINKYKVDAKKLTQLFDKDKFMVKITPIHITKSCLDNNIETTGGYEVYDSYRKVEQELKNEGFDVLVFIPSKEEDESRITCGNAILSDKEEETWHTHLTVQTVEKSN